MMFLYLLSLFLHYLPEFHKRNGADRDLLNKDRGTRFCLIKAYKVKHLLLKITLAQKRSGVGERAIMFVKKEQTNSFACEIKLN